MYKVFFMVILFIFPYFTGCIKQVTREEALKIHHDNTSAMLRFYPNIEKEKVIAACEKALSSFDSDYTFNHNPDGFYSNRKWFVYMVIAASWGENNWKIMANETPEGIKIQAKCWNGDSVAAGPIPVPIPGGSEQNFTISPGLYKLYFSRVDYILGLSDKCVSCEQGQKLFSYEGVGNATFESLCVLNKETLCTSNQDTAVEVNTYKR